MSGPRSDDDPGDPLDAWWAGVLAARRTGAVRLREPWHAIYGPLVDDPDAVHVVGQIGQSLDGRIATPSGHSHYVNGHAAIVHLHRLRALSDAVIVGVGTALADDPALTVRHVDGPSPCRVIVDPNGRLPPGARALADDGVRRIVVCGAGAASRLPHGVERLRIALGADGRLAPLEIVRALVERGLRRLLVEGGSYTLSTFVQAGCVHRLHVAVAPLIIGSGPVGLALAPIERLEAALRPPMRCHPLGDDMLWDVDLSASTVLSTLPRSASPRTGDRQQIEMPDSEA